MAGSDLARGREHIRIDVVPATQRVLLRHAPHERLRPSRAAALHRPHELPRREPNLNSLRPVVLRSPHNLQVEETVRRSLATVGQNLCTRNEDWSRP